MISRNGDMIGRLGQRLLQRTTGNIGVAVEDTTLGGVKLWMMDAGIGLSPEVAAMANLRHDEGGLRLPVGDSRREKGRREEVRAFQTGTEVDG